MIKEIDKFFIYLFLGGTLVARNTILYFGAL
ncbi:hypothetical protein EDC18_10465 [Natranaerovirga pectinivora]|uniref:Uncharacterized protein n=1 Tax=Natranaerovirga pectinivora TaxID=682400 RepID=A0A4R3MM52_9FIRM|nr:hypothetical protein EDC18_10465 [Natranaerovirga pectinivora]